MVERKRLGHGRDHSGPMAPPATTKAGQLGSAPQIELTLWQRMIKWRYDHLPRLMDINTLFVATGRHQLRLDWRHPLAIPMIILVVVLSPLLLLAAAVFRILDALPALTRPRTRKGIDR